MFDRLSYFFILQEHSETLIEGQYNGWLVVLSLLIATGASMMAFRVAGFAKRESDPWTRQRFLMIGAFALGGGIWSMHFVGMLAFELPAEVHYHGFTTLLSALPGFFASWVALDLLARDQISKRVLLYGGLLVGSGIGLMHYTGMEAMRTQLQLGYDPYWFAASIVIAVLLAVLALWVRFGLARITKMPFMARLFISGLTMGCAIAGMHYTAMMAARFVGETHRVNSHGLTDHIELALLITLVTILISGVVFGTVLLMRYKTLYWQGKETSARLSAIFDTAVDGIITIDPVGKISAFNPSAERILGWKAVDVLGKNIKSLMPEVHARHHDQYLKDYLKTGHASIIGVGREVEALHKDGHLVPIRLAIGETQVQDQKLFVGFITDLTQRRKMEQALLEREHQYRTLINNMPGVTFRCRFDEHFTVLFVSAQVKELLGWTSEEFTEGNVTLGALIHPEDVEYVWNVTSNSILDDKSWIIEYRFIHRDGSIRWVSESASGVRNEQGDLVWIDGVIIDVTESKRQNAILNGVLSAVNKTVAVCEYNENGLIQRVNDNFLILTGYTKEELLSQPYTCLNDHTENQLNWNELIEQGLLEGEYHRVRKDKKPLWVRSSFRVIQDIDHGHARVIELATDLTERRDMEIRLRQSKEKAEFAAQVKTNFLANMSHEIRTPMNAIIGFTDLLLDTPLQPTQQRHLTTVRRSAQSLLSLLNDILDTAKLEQGAVILESIDFSLRDVCDQVLATLGLSAYKKDLELICDYPEEQPTWFKGDPLRIQQVLINLVGNAIKFTHQGRIVLSVKYEKDLLLINVIDTGVGIAADRLDAIFDPFSQEDASTTRKYGGTGLGTSISKQLVEAMKGQIGVDSELGKGSCFSIGLPLPLGKEVIPSRIRASQAQLPKLRILIADDVPQNLELLALNFEKEQHQLQLVTNGYEAVLAFKEHPFDLVLMDVQMPEMDGYDATRKIREWERAHQQSPTPIIALTANVLEQDRINAESAGMSGFAIKPLNMLALREEIVRVLQLDMSQAEPSSDRSLAADGDEVRNVDVIDYGQGVALWGSKQTLHDVIKRFLAHNKETVDSLASLNPSQLLEQAHRLKGAAGNLALKSLAQAADALEKALKLKASNPHFDEEVHTLVLAFQQVYDLFDTSPNGKMFGSQIQLNADSVKKAKALIEQMLARLAKGELPDDCLDALAECLGSHAVLALTDCLEDFDFECAQSALIALQNSLDSNQEGIRIHE